MKFLTTCAMLAALMMSPSVSVATAETTPPPDQLIEQTVDTLLDEFTRNREKFQADKRELFELVERVVVPLFDVPRIAKLVLAKNWKQANATQRAAFADEFKKLLIGTYATALFRYTGNEGMTFNGAQIRERKGRQFAKVQSEVTLADGKPVAVDYALILSADGEWKIYNLTINGLNMVTSYRSTYAAAVGNLGLDGTIESMRQANAKNYR